MKKLLSCLTSFIVILLLYGNANAVAPTVQAYNMAFNNVQKNQLRISFTRGNGVNRIVVAQQTANPGSLSLPVDGTGYTADATFGNGSNLGNNTYVVYRGTGRALTVTGLSAGLPYSFMVIEYNGSGNTTEYLTSTSNNNPRYTYTIPMEPVDLSVSNITHEQFEADWSEPTSGDWDGYDLEIATDNSFNNLLPDYNPVQLGTDLDPDSYFLVEDLSANSTYYWRVRSRLVSTVSTWVAYSTSVTTRPVPPTASNITICGGNTATITPTAPNPATHTFKYYNASTGGDSLGIGSSFTTPALNTTTNYYVSSINNATNLESATRTEVQVAINPTPTPEISGESIACVNATNVYSTTNVTGNSYRWQVTGGTISGSDSASSVTINWGSGTTGTVIVKETVTSGNCYNSDTLNISIRPVPAPEISGSSLVCLTPNGVTYLTTNNAGNTYLWQVEGGSINGDATGNTVSIIWTAAGTGKVYVTETTSSNCSVTDTMNVTVQSVLNTQISGSTSVCLNSTDIYSTTENDGNTYSWSVTGGTISGASNTSSVSVNWNTQGNGRIIVTETAGAGCAKSDTMTVTVNSIPTPDVTGSTSLCANTQGEVYSTDSTGNSFNWTVVGGEIVSGQSTNSIEVNWGENAMTGKVILAETNNSDCTMNDTLSVTIRRTPNPSIEGSTQVCAFNTNSVYNVSPAVAGDTYSWTITGGTITSGAGTSLINVDWGNAGTGTISVDITTGEGCTATKNANITINPLPAPVISGNGNICANSTADYSVDNIDGHTYTWSVTGGTISGSNTENTVTVNWTTAGNCVVSVTEIDDLGCSKTANKSVTVYNAPATNVIGSEAVCVNSTNNAYSTTNNSNNTYSWTITGGTITSGDNTSAIEVTWESTGTGELILVETNPAGCFTTDTILVDVQSYPAPEISGSAIVCANSSMDYSVAENDGNTYEWSVTGGTITSGVGTSAITVKWGNGTSGSLSINETTSAGCANNSSIDITINPIPNPIISGAVSVCAGENNTAYSVTNNEGSTYNWIVTGGTPNDESSPSTTINWGDETGTGIVTVEETNEAGCTISNTIEVTINPVPAPVVSGNSSVCENSTYTYSTESNAGNTYKWTVTNCTIIGSDSAASVTIEMNSLGNGTISVTETTPVGCSASANLNISVNSVPTPDITGSTDVCANTTATYTTTNNDGNTYNWTVTNGTILSGEGTNSISVEWGNNTSGTVSVDEVATSGCSGTSARDITILPAPAPSISGNSIVCANSTGVTYSTTNNDDNTYNWTVTNGTITDGQSTSSITVDWDNSENGTVSVTETNPNGCSTEVELNIEIKELPAPAISGLTTVVEKSSSDYSTTDIAGNTYNWTVVGGTISSGDNTANITVNWDNPGEGSVSVEEATPAGCSVTTTMDITIRAELTPYKLVVTNTIGNQVAGTPFNINVQTQDSLNVPINVSVNTPVTVNIYTGTGTITGSGIIAAGTNSATISATFTDNNGANSVRLSINNGSLEPGLTNSFTVVAAMPAIQASNITWDNFSYNSITISCTPGNGSGRLILVKQENGFTSSDIAQTSTTYNTSLSFGNGDLVGSASAVYSGTGTSATVTNLLRNTRYYFKVLEYNGSENAINYNNNSASMNPRSRFTSPRELGPNEAPNSSMSGIIAISNISPNPAKDKISFKMDIAQESNVTVSLLNSAGQVVLNSMQNQKLAVGTYDMKIQLSNLAADSYIIMISAGNEIVVDKVVVLP